MNGAGTSSSATAAHAITATTAHAHELRDTLSKLNGCMTLMNYMIGTRDQPCWLAEAYTHLLLL